MRVLLPAFAAAALAALVLPAGPAFGHGGQPRSPAGEVPPDSRQPTDPPPPDTGGGNTPTPPDTGGTGTPTPPDTGGPGTPTPPDAGGGSSTPGGPPPSGPSGPGTRTRPPSGRTFSYESWRLWWLHNRDEILGRWRSLGAPSSGRASLSETAGGEGLLEEAQDVTAKAVEARVVPLLVRFAEDPKAHFDIRASALIGLARIGRKERIPLFFRVAREQAEGKPAGVVQESAALALGILQERTPEVRAFLADLALDPRARVRTRCFAAFSLGLLGAPGASDGADRESLAALESLVTGPEPNRDVPCSALLAIGLLGDRTAIPRLASWLREGKAGDRRLDDLQLSCAASALGRIGRPGYGREPRAALDALLVQVSSRNRLARWSAAIALGQIAPGSDAKFQRECAEDLAALVASEGRPGTDSQTVDFALAALGRVAGAVPGPRGDGCLGEVRARAAERLLDAFEGSPPRRPFAALGLGIAAPGLDAARRTQAAETIRRTLERSRGDVEERGALCISLGLLGDLEAGPALAGLLRDRGVDPRLRGAAAVGLGLLGDRAAGGPVREALRERSDHALRIDAAIAAGLLRDPQAVEVLLEILTDPKSSQFVLGSAASALGRIGDRRAVEPLAAILEDGERYQDLTRALACTALGQIGDRGAVPVLARVSTDVNYRAYFDAIGELLTIL